MCHCGITWDCTVASIRRQNGTLCLQNSFTIARLILLYLFKERRCGQENFEGKVIDMDEVSMKHKYAIHAVDRSLQDLRQDHRPFGGISIIFSGDFRQTLPVVPHSSLQAQAWASHKYSPIWLRLEKFRLRVNVHLRRTSNLSEIDKIRNNKFSDCLLDIGGGFS